MLLAATLWIPQNLDDVLTAYLARVGYWIQHGDMSPFPTSIYNSVQVSYPANAQLPVLRSIVLSGAPTSWVWNSGPRRCSAPSVCSASPCAERAAGGRVHLRRAWLLIPAVAHQAGVALTDLVSVWLVLCTLWCSAISAGWSSAGRCSCCRRSRSDSPSGPSRQSSSSPGLAIVTLAALVFGWHQRLVWVKWVALSIPIVVVLGFVDYLRNWSYFGHPFGEPDSFELFAVDATIGERISAIETNLRQAVLDTFFGDLNPGVGEHVPGLCACRCTIPSSGRAGIWSGVSPGWASSWPARCWSGRSWRCTRSSGGTDGLCWYRSSLPPPSS